jgi:hypothetical protein
MFSRPPSAAELIFGSDDDIVALSEGLASSWAPVVHVSNGSHYDAFVLEKCSPRLEAERRMRLRFRSHPGKWPSHVLSALSAHRGLTSVNLNLGYCIMTDNWHLPPASPASSKSQDLGTWLAALPRLAHLELTHDNFTSISDRWGAWPKNIERQRVCGAWMEAHLGPLYQGLSKSKSIRSLLLPMMACENVNTEPLAHMAQLEQLFNVRHDMIEHMAINTPNVVNLWRLDVMAEANNFKPRLTAMK